MKKLLLLLFLLPLISFNTLDSDFKIVGKWKGEDKGDIGYLILDKEGYATFEFNGLNMGGKEYEQDGIKAKMEYALNQDTKPMQLDFIITVLETGEINKMQGIVEFEGKDRMHLSLAFGEQKRPTDFSGSNSIYFNRVK